MVFSKEWDQVFKQRSHMSIWPWSDVVSFVMRYVKPSGNMDQYKVLELGCGPGANISFFSTLGVDYYAVEGSREIVKNLWEQYPSLKDKIVVADFTEEIPFDCAFDLVIDRGSMTHNTTKSIENGLDLIYGRLKKNGLYMGFDWFSTLHSDFRKGEFFQDENTRTNITTPQFMGLGNVHFSDKEHIEKLFYKFTIENMELKKVLRHIPDDNHIFACWNFTAKKVEENE